MQPERRGSPLPSRVPKTAPEMKPDLSIALVCQSLRLDGGMGRYALDLIEGLNELGIRPTVYTKKIDERVCSGLSIDPVRINCRPFPTKLRDYYFNFRVKRLIAQRSFDAVLSNIRFPGATVTFCGGTHIGYLRGLGKNALVLRPPGHQARDAGLCGESDRRCALKADEPGGS